jgi:hypothetical protein
MFEALGSTLSTRKKKKKKEKSSRVLVLTPVIPATWEAEIGRITV